MINKEDMKRLEKEARRAWELEKGKTIIVEFDNCKVRADYHCLDKDTKVCETCKLRFRCYLGQFLTIDYKELHLNIDTTLNEAVEGYVEGFKGERKTKTDK